MTRVVILVEEESARIVVSDICARMRPGEAIVVSHEGKSDLEASIPRKLRAWVHPADVPFIVIRDNDGANCTTLKERLNSLVPPTCANRTKIRIIMHSLESWYLGDLNALAAAGLITTERAHQLARTARLRNPEGLTNAKDVFLDLHKERGQLGLAAKIAPHLSLENNRARSFGVLIETLRRHL